MKEQSGEYRPITRHKKQHGRWLLFLMILPFLLTLSSCSSGAKPADPDVRVSLRTSEKDGEPKISIQKDALNREFLFQGNSVTLNQAGYFNGLKSRIVTFQQKGTSLFLLESPKGHTVTPDNPFALILAEFPILEDEGGWITFDFNAGMSKIFMTEEMYASDFYGEDYQPSFKTAPVRHSFLNGADVRHLNRLAVHQAAQVEDEDGSIIHAEVHYYLSPYRPDPDFEPTPSPGFAHAGYFEVMPQLKAGGGTEIFVMKWNIHKGPITYSMSANTPEEFREAIRNGVLYWNAALGQEVFAVDVAPEGVRAPDMDRNIIQWLDFDTAGFAYADMQADPRTGEILHSQIFMSSMWSVKSRKDAWRFVYQNKRTHHRHPSSDIYLTNFTKRHLCTIKPDDRMVTSITRLLSSNATDDMFLRAAQAEIQETITHEVGHTMGLRHNFAGNLQADLDHHSREDLYQLFLDRGAYRSVIPTTSIMDYNQHYESALNSRRYNEEEKALPHDISAMRYLYLGEPMDKDLYFCTDTDMNSMVDCLVFAHGTSPIAYGSSELYKSLQPKNLARELYLQMVLDILDGTPVDELYMNPEGLARSILSFKQKFLQPFTENAFYARALKSRYSDPGSVSSAQKRRDTVPLVEKDLEDWLLDKPYGLESLTDMFMVIQPEWEALWKNEFSILLDDPRFYNIETHEGGTLHLSAQERQKLKEAGNVFFEGLISALVSEDVKLLSEMSPIDIVDSSTGDDLLAAYKKTSRTYLMEKTSSLLNVSVGGQSLSLPVFRYEWQLRANARNLLDDRAVSSALWWGRRESRDIYQDLLLTLNTVVGPTGKDFFDSLLYDEFLDSTKPAFQWYLENCRLVGCGY
ncbi:zinc-dependent metalloprotease [Desulfobotulus sp. H1]|uniref:Zinc-dependent metalloprotease n=1 Tax=Desulfobotulus pelophilus TaxID=2823377 RepID=A0ABT3N7F5_9BACT|nr:zinc-dependent metalloprotease [Desulfobotulus pelophilus]MCW7753388.1 zinc-dependent metalloprotease [Desulfobotulus pelophilus]